MSRVLDPLGHKAWAGLGVVIGLFVAVFIATQQILWLYIMILVLLLLVAAGLILELQAARAGSGKLSFYSLSVSVFVVGAFSAGLFLWTVGPILNVPISAPLNTSAAEALPIESIPLSVYSYDGRSNPSTSIVYLGSGRLTATYGPGRGPSYKLDYDVPATLFAYAGLAFEFLNPQDFSGYRFLEVAMSFENSEASCHLLIKDDTFSDDRMDQMRAVRLSQGGTSGEDVSVRATDKGHVFKIPLKTNWQLVNWSSVRALRFYVDTFPDAAKSSFTITQITFLKE